MLNQPVMYIPPTNLQRERNACADTSSSRMILYSPLTAIPLFRPEYNEASNKIRQLPDPAHMPPSQVVQSKWSAVNSNRSILLGHFFWVLAVPTVSSGLPSIDINKTYGGNNSQTYKILIFIKISRISFMFPSYPLYHHQWNFVGYEGNIKEIPWDLAEKSRFCKFGSCSHRRFFLYRC